MPGHGGQSLNGGRRRPFAALMATTALSLAALLAALGNHAMPSTEAVRVRNAFIADVGTNADFNWSPVRTPAGFRQQKGVAPAPFAEAARRVARYGSELERTVALVQELDVGHDHGGPIQRSTLDTYRIIREAGGGYCADYTQVLNGLAWAARIPVREWGVAFDGFGGFGHAFNEVYDAGLGKWVLVDPFYAFYARDSATGAPLSAIEFRDRLRERAPLETMEIVRLVPQAYDFTNDEKLLAFYRRGVDQFYLWWGNDVFDYDDHPLVRAVAPASRGLEQLTAIIAGVHPRIRILPTTDNAAMIEGLQSTRLAVSWLAVACLALVILLCVQWRLWRRMGRGPGRA